MEELNSKMFINVLFSRNILTQVGRGNYKGKYRTIGGKRAVDALDSYIDKFLTSLSLENKLSSLALIIARLKKYENEKKERMSEERVFSFKTGRWSLQSRIKAKDPDVIIENGVYGKPYEMSIIKAITQESFRMRDVYPEYFEIKEEIKITDIPDDDMKILFSGKEAGKGAYYATFPYKSKTQKDAFIAEKYMNIILRKIIRPSSNLSTKQMFKKIVHSYRNYNEGYPLDENQGKFFSVQTGRWRLGKSKSPKVFTNKRYQLHGVTQESVDLYIRFNPSTGKKRKHEKVLVEHPGPIEKKNDSWSNIRFKTWIRESERIQEWGHPNYFEGDKGRCFACFKPVSVNNYEAAHIRSRARGGKDVVSNLRVSCKECNRGRGGMGTTHAYEWLLMKKMEGLAMIPRTDNQRLIAELLHREALLVEALSKERNVKISKSQVRMIRSTSPIESRLDTMWDVLQKCVPSLPNLHNPSLMGKRETKKSWIRKMWEG